MKKNGVSIDLKSMADKVVELLNQRIDDPEHYFHFNNHRTIEDNSMNREQRKSATFYALYTCGIPAFGIESSKELPLEQKVRQHIYAINGFMDILNIVPETPGFHLREPLLEYLILSVNGSIPVVVKNQQHLVICSRGQAKGT